MIKPALTQLALRYTSILFAIFMMANGLHSQVSYSCSYDDSLQPGTVAFEVIIFGNGPGETWTLDNVANLYSNIDPDILINDGFVIPEDPLNPGTYRVTGFAYDGIMPFATVMNDNVPTIDMNMLTCMSPTTEITGDAQICEGGTASYTLTVSNPNILPGSVMWSSTGNVASSMMYGTDDLMFDISYAETGSHLITVSGETTNGFTFSDNFIVNVFDIAEDYEISGPMYLCTANNDSVVYTINIPDSIAVNWSSSPGVNMITPLTGSGSSVSVDFPDTPGIYTLSVENQDPDGCTISGVIKPVRIVDVIDTVSIVGDAFVCLGDSANYSVDSSYLNVSWSVTPGDPPGSGGFVMNPMSGSGSSVVIQYTESGSYEVEVSGNTPDGCPFESSLNVVVPGDSIGSLACNNQVNVSLNNTCILELFPDMILEGEFNMNEAYTLTIKDAQTGEILEDNMLTQDQLGETFIVTVTQECGGNSCWGTVVVEDKSITELEPFCPGSASITCFDFAENPQDVGFPEFPDDVTVVYRPDKDNFLVSGFDNCSDVILSYFDVNVSADECTDPQHIIRTWTAVDINNGLSSTCTVDIFIGLVDKSNIIWPPFWDTTLDDDAPGEPDTDNTFGSLDACDMNNPPELFCNSWLNNLDANGNPSPECTGYPRGLVCTNLQLIGYKDEVIPICGNSRKILRKWAVWDACTNEDVMYTQIITIMDNEKPICIPPDDKSYFTDTHECGSDIILDPPTVTNECAGWTYRVEYKTNDFNDGKPETFRSDNLIFDPTTNRYTINNLNFEFDSLYVRYIITDVCGNRTDDCFGCFGLIDDEQPIPACDLYSTVSLNNGGFSYAGTSTFDDHSWDNCGVYTKVIQRMDPRCGCFERKLDFMYNLGEFNGHYYFLSREKFDGTKAFNFAEALDGYVAVINNNAENDWLREAVSEITDDRYYIGLKGGNFSSLQWVGDTSSFNYSGLWDSSEPFPDENFRKGDVFTVVNDDGSWEAERQSALHEFYVVEFETKCGWTQKEAFCCEDLGKETMVSMRVIDLQGNHNFCMVNVEVQDFIPPLIICPDDATIDCATPFDLDDLSEFGDLDDVQAFDDCEPTVSVQPGTFSPSNCGGGVIRRVFTATDGTNVSSCVQRIFVQNDEELTFDDIIWPTNVNITDLCSLEDYEPGNNVPRWDEDKFRCSNIIYTYDDLLFTVVQGACQKLVRTWTVVDWCHPTQQFTYDQVIKLMNTNGPVLSSGTCRSMLIDNGQIVGPCLIQVDDITASVDDAPLSCNELIEWSYTIDYNSDGTIDVTGSGNDASGTFPYGTHRLVWSAKDACDNVTSCTKIITVVDNKAPTPYCHGEIVLTVGSEEGVEIWAVDLDIGSVDDCPSNPVTLSFSENSIVSSYAVDCSDIPDTSNVGYVFVDLWVWDHPNPSIANKSYCTVRIQVQDNLGVCGSNKPARISGEVMTEEHAMIENVEMELMAGMPGYPKAFMTDEGQYAFEDLPMYNDYSVSARKNDDYLNGVSTLDLLIIQRHILGIERLDSPYKLIAADVNNSQGISAVDLIELRKLILGIYEELPHNDSWRFIDEEFNFTDPYAPWPFKEKIDLDDLDHEVDNANFMGVKIGDVNGSAITSQINSQDPAKNASIYKIAIRQSLTEKGNTRIQLIAGQGGVIAGTQFSLGFDNYRTSLIAGIPGKLELEHNHIAWQNVSEGIISISCDADKPVELEEGEVLMEFLFEGTHSDLLIHPEPKLLRPEFYTIESGALRTNSILMMQENTKVGAFELYQNTPNPFSEFTRITFNLPADDEIELSISDATGRVIYKSRKEFQQGYNEWLIRRDMLNTTGILYYTLSTATQSTTRKMIVLR